MGSKAFMLIVLAILLVITSEVAARELADSKASSKTTNDPKFIGYELPGFREGRLGGFPIGGYGGYRGYPGGGYDGYG
ncbi:uncharacterized protein LOC132051154 [Lycium ferocissimum]|uniref:uncharacterized protein LOC132051154 n=1 Tax=Lycium ferocissimum TaxID=112874 RepID=UPI002814F694|nr:uncharacterized protein LOC132051154 [Lycium ferocissimum]